MARYENKILLGAEAGVYIYLEIRVENNSVQFLSGHLCGTSEEKIEPGFPTRLI